MNGSFLDLSPSLPSYLFLCPLITVETINTVQLLDYKPPPWLVLREEAVVALKLGFDCKAGSVAIVVAFDITDDIAVVLRLDNVDGD